MKRKTKVKLNLHEPSAITVYQDALHDKNSTCRAISNMAAEWRNFKAKMKAKRIDKGKGKKKDTISAFNDENDTLVVQRLSAEVSGKAQKYSRIGAREFVSYEYEEFTIENIRRACEKHFAVDKSKSCDILAGEQGPSCNKVKQIPDSRVIHVRFVEGVPVVELRY